MLMANRPVLWSTVGAVKSRKVKVGGLVLGVTMPCKTLTAGCTFPLASSATMNTCICSALSALHHWWSVACGLRHRQS